MDSLLSFPVRLFHPLQHAGLSRRSPGSPSSEQSAQIGMLRATAAIFLYVGSASPNVFSRCPTAQPCDAKNDSVKPKDNIPDDRQNKRYDSIVVLYEGMLCIRQTTPRIFC